MMWICPACHCSDAPEWNWVKIQGEEGLRIPTCPDCGYEMEEAEECPLCGEPMREGKDVCFDCWHTMVKGLVSVANSVSLRSTSDLTKWETIRAIADTMVVRFEEMEKKK